MKKANRKIEPEMQPDYDFSSGVRGKYSRRFVKGSNVIVLEPDVAKFFPDSETVNRSLRALSEIIRQSTHA